MSGVYGLVCGAWGLGLGSEVWGLGLRVWGLGSGGWGLGFGVTVRDRSGRVFVEVAEELEGGRGIDMRRELN